MSSLWEVTGQFICTASDTVICKLTPAGEPYAALIAAAPELLAERNRLQALNAELAAALDSVLKITWDSEGVAGYHRNGDVAGWDEFTEIEQARAALEKHTKESA